jgi:hypothetical protein
VRPAEAEDPDAMLRGQGEDGEGWSRWTVNFF